MRTIEHGDLKDETTCDRFVQHGAYLVPTLSTYSAIAEVCVQAGMPDALRAEVFEVADAGARALKMASRLGVQLVYGTDLLGAMRRGQLDRFGLRKVSVSSADQIRRATSTAAEAFKREVEFGIVREGARADLLAVAGNPLDEIGVLQAPKSNLKLTVKGGGTCKNTLGE